MKRKAKIHYIAAVPAMIALPGQVTDVTIHRLTGAFMSIKLVEGSTYTLDAMRVTSITDTSIKLLVTLVSALRSAGVSLVLKDHAHALAESFATLGLGPEYAWMAA